MKRYLPWMTCCAVCLLTVLTVALPGSVEAVTLGAGWTHSDVGLHNKGDGFYLGVGNAIPLKSSILDASYSLEYVQKKGSHPTPFADPFAGFVVEDAEVTLHVLEPSVFLGAKIPNLPMVPRLYVGGSIGLKVKESWSDFPGTPDKIISYKDTDAILHVGASLGLGPVAVDVRWSKSMVGQLLIDDNVPLSPASKATDPLADVREVDEGFDTEVFRVGVVYGF